MSAPRVLSVALLGLAGATLASGILLAYARHEHRAQFRAMQALIGERDQLEMEWGALQLERAAWFGYHRLGREAAERLGMREPGQQDVVFLRAARTASALPAPLPAATAGSR